MTAPASVPSALVPPEFVPLACERCSGDLVGRAVDAVLLCRPCGAAYLVRDERVAAIPIASVVVPTWRDATLALPFWTDGSVASPAFLSARPIVLTHIATRLLSRWARVPGGGALPAVGAQLLPETITVLARLAEFPVPELERVTLLAVPVRSTGTRFFLPGEDRPLFPEDVPEAGALVQIARD